MAVWLCLSDLNLADADTLLTQLLWWTLELTWAKGILTNHVKYYSSQWQGGCVIYTSTLTNRLISNWEGLLGSTNSWHLPPVSTQQRYFPLFLKKTPGTESQVLVCRNHAESTERVGSMGYSWATDRVCCSPTPHHSDAVMPNIKVTPPCHWSLRWWLVPISLYI